MKIIFNVNASELDSSQKQTVGIDEHDSDENNSIDTEMKRIETDVIFELS